MGRGMSIGRVRPMYPKVQKNHESCFYCGHYVSHGTHLQADYIGKVFVCLDCKAKKEG